MRQTTKISALKDLSVIYITLISALDRSVIYITIVSALDIPVIYITIVSASERLLEYQH